MEFIPFSKSKEAKLYEFGNIFQLYTQKTGVTIGV